MELSKAVAKALKFVPRKHENPLLLCLRLLPKVHGTPARVMATDGMVTCLIDVEGELPNALIPGAHISQAAKATIRKFVETESGVYRAVTDTGEVSVGGADLTSYPGIPAIPELHWVEDWDWMVSVLHAVAKGKDEPANLKCIHFGADYVEATDRQRHARVWKINPVGMDWKGLVPAETFKNWPKGPVCVGFTSQHAFFRIGSELRYTNLEPTPYPDTTKITPMIHHGQWWTTAPKVLLEAVKQATGFSPQKTVSLHFGLTGIEIGSWSDAENSFGGRVDATPGTTGPVLEGGTVLVSGKNLAEALKVVQTPKVRVCYGGPLQPVRVESGPYVESLWPVMAGGTA